MAGAVLFMLTGLAYVVADGCGVIGCDPCTTEDVTNLRDSLGHRATNKTLYPNGMDEVCVKSAEAASILSVVSHECTVAAKTLIAATKVAIAGPRESLPKEIGAAPC